ncbi:uncharacterized protein LOC127858304 [Dreissena polymorpha]|uniref:uncharacterized protein LOC127858304 n=1 Tax=Dreissena polymorpha TaxID=45954 RepID=UPI002265013D|nr:uncharacterized protein LOC127858304 [Dreissena polymorpha]
MRLKYQRTLRRLQRYKKAEKKTDESECCTQQEYEESLNINKALTPNSKTKRMMKMAKLSREQRSKVHKQLLFSFAVQNQMKTEKRGIKPTEKGSLRTHIGSILKKYGLKKTVSKNTGLSRNCLNGLSMRDITRRRETRKYKQKVIDFLSRDDNSRSNPGQRDKVKTPYGQEQTRTLTDYMKNLYQKFMSENLTVKLSLYSFCKLRPRSIKLSAFITRSSCLCTKHQNMSLSARVLRGCGLNLPINPKEFVKDERVNHVLENDIPDSIKVGQWKRVPVEEKGKKKMIMKIVESEFKREDFLKFVKEQMQSFSEHVYRVKRQYEEIKQLKENLKATDAILHMDFAENYTCKSVEEIQTAYWNKTGVTLHPIVVYYKGDEDTLSHKSMVMVSDEQGHNSSTVLAFLDKAIPRVKTLVNGLERIHYWTDSPTSQYRNKTIFDAVERHEELFGVKAS